MKFKFSIRSMLVSAALCLLIVSSLSAMDVNSKKSKKCRKSISDEDKFDCMPGFNTTVTRKQCEDRGCCFHGVTNQTTSGPYEPDFPEDRFPIHVGAPSCYYPLSFPSYKFESYNATDYGMTALLKRTNESAYKDDVKSLRMDVYMETKTRLRIKITDAENQRYEVPVPKLPTTNISATETDYSFVHSESGEPAGFSIVRKSTNETLFNASVGNFIFANRFIQLSALLPTTNLYGLGQHNDNFKRSFDWQLIPLFASLFYPDYASHPFYLAMEKSHQSHGVFLFNSNAMDVLLQPTPAITYRITGGILDFYFFLGPTPEDVIQQYTTLIGKPVLPPYWSLGFHLCKYNYLSVENTREAWERTVNAGIPIDVQWNDIDYMDNYRIFTYDQKTFAGLPKLVDDIHAKHMKYVPIIDCGVSVPKETEKNYTIYDEGKELDIFIKGANGSYASGRVWPEYSVFPDFTNPKTQQFWTNGYKRLYDDVKYDGAWIDMDEPSTFSNGSVEDKGCPDDEPLQFTPAVEGGKLYSHTICMSSKQYGGSHFDLHSLYGFTEAIATNNAMKEILQKRPFVMSRSTAPGHGHYGTHWTGDVYSKWHDLKQSIPAILNFNLYGIPMVGSDICGFRGNTTLQLCQRWTSLGAFYPFSRNHNENITIDQDPVALGQEMVDTAISVLKLRYTLLPFFYTRFYKVHLFGGTVVRPLFFEFPEDETTYNIEDQFMWGSDLMVMPVLEENSTSITPYFPKGYWYLYPMMQFIDSTGSRHQLNVSMSEIAMGLRGGSIIVTQEPNQTTFESRQNDFSLMVALDENYTAQGELYWDDGESLDPVENDNFTHINFIATPNTLSVKVDKFNYQGDVEMVVNTIVVFGVTERPDNVTLDGQSELNFEHSHLRLRISDVGARMKRDFTVTWITVNPTTGTTQTTNPTTETKQTTTIVTTPTTMKSSGQTISPSIMIQLLIVQTIIIFIHRTFPFIPFL